MLKINNIKIRILNSSRSRISQTQFSKENLTWKKGINSLKNKLL